MLSTHFKHCFLINGLRLFKFMDDFVGYTSFGLPNINYRSIYLSYTFTYAQPLNIEYSSNMWKWLVLNLWRNGWAFDGPINQLSSGWQTEIIFNLFWPNDLAQFVGRAHGCIMKGPALNDHDCENFWHWKAFVICIPGWDGALVGV